MFGITPLGPSYDTPGFYGWSVDDAVYVYEAVAPSFLAPKPAPRRAAKLAVCIPEDPHISDAIPEMKASVRRLADAFAAAGHKVERARSPISFERLFKIQRSTMAYECGRALKHLLEQPAGTVGEKLDGAHPRRAGHSRPAVSRRARRDRRRCATTLFSGAEGRRLLWPAAPATAPEGLGWTGDPKYISPWTALGGPIVTVPAGFAGNGLPIAVHPVLAPRHRPRHVRLGARPRATESRETAMQCRLAVGERDVLGWRRKLGVMAPSTNTIVQPDFDDMRPLGVTNHYSRIFTPNTNALSNETFRAGIGTIGSNVMDAIKSVMTCEPDYLVMGISALSVLRRRQGRATPSPSASRTRPGSASPSAAMRRPPRIDGPRRHQAHRRADALLARHERRGAGLLRDIGLTVVRDIALQCTSWTGIAAVTPAAVPRRDPPPRRRRCGRHRAGRHQPVDGAPGGGRRAVARQAGDRHQHGDLLARAARQRHPRPMAGFGRLLEEH